MFVTGPNVVKTVTHEEVDAEFLGGATTHTTKSAASRTSRRADEASALDAARRLLGYLPQNNLGRRAACPRRPIPSDRMDAALDTIVPDDPRRPYDMHDVIDARGRRRRVPRDPAGLGAEHHRRVRAARRSERRHRRAAAGGPRRCARHRCVDQGRAVRPDVRLLQRAAGHVRRRPGLPARCRPGARRHHQARREAAVRLLRGDGPEADGHHAQGIRRRVRRHEQQAHPRAT